MNDLNLIIDELNVIIMDLTVDNNLVIMSAFMITNSDLLVETNYGPLFLDEEDFKKFKFDPYWVVENYDSTNVAQLMTEIKIYYTKLSIEKLEEE